jgi:hypothetical protein
LCFYSAGMLSPYAPAKDIHPIFRIHFTKTYHCEPAVNSIISQYISICMKHIYSHNLHPYIHTYFTNKIQYHAFSNEFFVKCSNLWVSNYSNISNLLYYQFPYFCITWLKRHELRLTQRDKQAFMFHKLIKYILRQLKHYTSTTTTLLYASLHVSNFYTVIFRPFLRIKLPNATYMLGSHYVYNDKIYKIWLVNYINKDDILFKTMRR